jgi:hypothetical protein
MSNQFNAYVEIAILQSLTLHALAEAVSHTPKSNLETLSVFVEGCRGIAGPETMRKVFKERMAKITTECSYVLPSGSLCRCFHHYRMQSEIVVILASVSLCQLPTVMEGFTGFSPAPTHPTSQQRMIYVAQQSLGK